LNILRSNIRIADSVAKVIDPFYGRGIRVITASVALLFIEEMLGAVTVRRIEPTGQHPLLFGFAVLAV
jgi:hypothetical protein